MKIIQKVVRSFVAVLMIPATIFGGIFFSLLRYAVDGTLDGFKIMQEDIAVFLKWLVFIDAEIN